MIQVKEDALPEGEYAVVEVLGHRTYAGRIAEVERFGTKFLQVEPLFADWLLDPVLIGGASVYQLTPCAPLVAWSRRPKQRWSVGSSLTALLPPEAEGEEAASRPDWLVDPDEIDADAEDLPL